MGLYNLYCKAWPHLVLFLSSDIFSYFLLITIDKIIFTFFPQLPLYPLFSLLFSCFCVNFIPLLLSPAFPSWRSFSYFTNFFISFFKFFLIFVVSIQFSSSISLASFKFIISCSSFSWISTPFSLFPPFSFLFSSSLFSSSSYPSYTVAMIS